MVAAGSGPCGPALYSFGLAEIPMEIPESKSAPRTPSSPRSPVYTPRIHGFQEIEVFSLDSVPAERHGKAIPLSSAPPCMQPSRRTPSPMCVMPTALDDSSWTGPQLPVQPPSPVPVARRPSTTKTPRAADSNIGLSGRSRVLPMAYRQEKADEFPSLLEAFGGFYKELIQGIKCTMPDSVVIHDRSAEMDLSHEFPPERREAQIDPRAAMHPSQRLTIATPVST